ncbi:peroxisome biogenesis protein 2 isoform X2 [Elaeis guineensis]|uniref:RING-type E3 ubiquitin transferase (cysteine targeting) n=1 Tax=Elaeis guineensis var. tenera TaxID=51953 RepID=A0A6I9RFN2_ELAGV|nr:peroxisome biogenesis protein 2 isoform X3 [Elaeis guineensis]
MEKETLVSSSSSSSSWGADPPPEDCWIEAHRELLPRWRSLRESSQTPIPISISRVNQFDAARLDVEMTAMLKEQLVKVFSLMKPGFLFQYEPELDAFLEFLIWRFSIWVDKPTPGNALMNLRYRDERAVPTGGKEGAQLIFLNCFTSDSVRTGLEGPGLSVSQKIWYCLTTVGGRYIWSRLQSFSAFRRWGDFEQRSLGRRLWLLIQRVEGLYKAASFSNLLIFLYTGRYRSIIERALKARLVYGSPNMNRAVSFEYMNRQLVWNEFSEMLLLLLPLLNSSSIKKFLLPFSKDKTSGSSSDESECPICHANPTIPFVALPCQHRYCYYCLRTRCAAVGSYRCARCNEAVVAIQRHGLGEGRTSKN